MGNVGIKIEIRLLSKRGSKVLRWFLRQRIFEGIRVARINLGNLLVWIIMVCFDVCVLSFKTEINKVL